jgi:hypothetical protein
MMFGGFFDTSAIDAFAQDVVRELRKAVPPEGSDQAARSRRRKELDERLLRMTTALVRTHRLNVYQKAKLGPRVQARMEAEGYGREFSESFSFELVKLVAMSKG